MGSFRLAQSSEILLVTAAAFPATNGHFMARGKKQPVEQKEKKVYRKTGRPSSYDPAYHLKTAFNLTVSGYTNDEIAAIFGIDHDTFYEWLRKYKDFSDAVARGKEPTIGEVGNALRERARGFEWWEEVPLKVKQPDGSEKIVITKVKRLVPPDTNAASLYLRNRAPDKWRDQQHIETTGDLKAAEELQKLLAVARGGGHVKAQKPKD